MFLDGLGASFKITLILLWKIFKWPLIIIGGMAIVGFIIAIVLGLAAEDKDDET